MLDIEWNDNMKKKSMKREINLQFMWVTIIVIFSMTVLLSCVFYELFKSEVLEDLKTYTLELKSVGLFDDTSDIKEGKSFNEFRITVIGEDGTVLYDNRTDIAQLDNHGTRPEVEQAFKAGEGEAIRESATFQKSTFYYAVQLDKGHVLRVAKEAESVWSIFMKAMPLVGLTTIVMVITTFLIARHLTSTIVAPIEQMAIDMERMDSVQTYEELQPFVDTIMNQHEDILKNAQIRQEFTANVSHELKTPLTAISGYAELIENGMATDKDVIRFSKEIHLNSNRLLNLINDIIHLSELDVVENGPAKEDIDLYEIGQTQVDMLQINADKYGVSLSMEGKARADIFANKMMMEELVYNLVDNAIRYNQKKGWVKVKVESDSEKVRLIVEDNGIGISEENQERNFERFFRLDKSHSRQIGGTGLGLAIVKHIVAKHQARIHLESELDKGTKITVIFPKKDMLI